MSKKKHISHEKAKARELRNSLWWRQQLGTRTCYHCKGRFEKTDLTMDHLIPISRGGRSIRRNVVAACKDCNSKKGYRTLADMALERL